MKPQPSQYPIEIRELTKRYGNHTVVDRLSFTVKPGRVTGFLGPNGSGKSTTMKILLDLASADHGTARIGGVRYRDLAEPARTVGVVLEPNAFHPGRSGRNHLRIIAEATGQPMRRVDDSLAMAGLNPESAKRRVATYSLGMKQRLSLAAALLGDPPVLVLDEPANGLDPQGIHDLRDLLRSRASEGHTVLVSSHLLAEMEHLVDDVVVISEGRLVTSGPIEDLTGDSAIVRTPCPSHLAEVLIGQGASVTTTSADALVTAGLGLDQIGAAAHSAGIVLHELSRNASSLEDLFLDLTAPTSAATTHEKGE